MIAKETKQLLKGTRWLFKVGLVVVLGIAPTLWSDAAHAEWHTLSGILPAYATNPSYAFSPDSRTVAFTSEIETDDVNELYAVPITGTIPIKLNPPLVQDGDVLSSFSFTPDSQAVIYRADQEVDNRIEMYRVPVNGGEAVKLNPPLVAGGNIISFKIDKEDERIVYLADQETNEINELWSMPLSGGPAVKLNGALVTGGNISRYEIDPLSNRVVYSADAEVDGKFELYSVPIAGGTVMKLNPPIVLAGGGDSGLCCEFAIHPTVPVVVFIARQTDAKGGRLYMIPTGGGDLTQLSFDPLATQRILSFLISPVGDRVVFNVGTQVGSTFAFKGNLYSNLIGGGGAANVTETADPLFGTDNYRILPDGSRIVYSFQNNADSPIRLETATMLGVRTPLYVPGPSGPQLYNFDYSLNSEWVIYQDANDGQPSTIYTTPPTGGTPTSFVASTYRFVTPDSSRIGYTRIVSDASHTELFSAQIFGGGIRNLSGMQGTGFAFDPRVSPDGNWIGFVTQIDERYELRVSDGEEAQPPIIPPAPVAGLSAVNDGPKVVSEPISFTASITGGTEISYTWDFGDGNAADGEAASHAYTQTGTYTATVVASNTTNSMTATTTVYVGDAIVEVFNNQYTSANVTIDPGGTVVWVLKEGTHSVTADDGSFEQPAGSDWPPFVHVFVVTASSHATIIPYHCTVHGVAMSGTVTVTGEDLQVRLLLPNLHGAQK